MTYARAAAARGYRSARRFCGTRSHERVPEAAIPTTRLSPRCARRARRGRRPRARIRAGGQAGRVLCRDRRQACAVRWRRPMPAHSAPTARHQDRDRFSRAPDAGSPPAPSTAPRRAAQDVHPPRRCGRMSWSAGSDIFHSTEFRSRGFRSVPHCRRHAVPARSQSRAQRSPAPRAWPSSRFSAIPAQRRKTSSSTPAATSER